MIKIAFTLHTRWVGVLRNHVITIATVFAQIYKMHFMSILCPNITIIIIIIQSSDLIVNLAILNSVQCLQLKYTI